MVLAPESLPSGAAVGGWGVQEGSKEPWVGDATCSLQSAEELVVMQFFPPELSISQEIGISKFLHQHFIQGQTIQFIHENTLANYHRLLIYLPPPRMGI
jgi:hypothetical protein